jgi:outer membrane protein TolC
MKKWLVFMLPILLALQASAQTQLDRYIAEGLKANDGIRAQEFSLQKSLFALEEARSLFLPQVTLQGNYFLAGGGRTVDFPVGDLLNPVYSTLNELTQSQQFPQLENQRILLNPSNFYDVKLHTTYPIINAEIRYNQRIRRQQVTLQEIAIDLYSRELVKDIKTAYFRYLQADEAVKIYQSALKLVQENLRINQALFNNDKVNRTAVLRSENEVTKYQAQVTSAQENTLSARAYFNFLLNRPTDAIIEPDPAYALPPVAALDNNDISEREELKQINTAQQINDQLVGLAQQGQAPKLNTFLDLGSQGFEFNVDRNTPYYFFGLAFEWNLFNGGRDKAKVKQAQMDGRILAAQNDQLADQLRLQLTTSIHAYRAAQAQYRAAVAQQVSAENFSNDLLKLYKEGSVLYIEVLDAQNQWITAQLQTNIALYDTWLKATDIERANASFQLK